jgi:hypothetical protein
VQRTAIFVTHIHTHTLGAAHQNIFFDNYKTTNEDCSALHLLNFLLHGSYKDWGAQQRFSIYYLLYFELLRPLGRRDIKKCPMGFSPTWISALAIIEYNNKKTVEHNIILHKNAMCIA